MGIGEVLEGERQAYVVCSRRRRRCNQTPVSNACKAAASSSFWASNGLNKLPVVLFEFLFNLAGKSTMAFPTASGGSRGGARGPALPPYFWSKLRPERPKNFFFWGGGGGRPPPPPPYLRV